VRGNCHRLAVRRVDGAADLGASHLDVIVEAIAALDREVVVLA
jgi:hypothetical protein